MTMRTIIRTAAALLVALAGWQGAAAQHTLGAIASYGMSTARINPTVEKRAVWGTYGGGLTWRYYGRQRFTGGFGVDLEFLQQGFSYATNTAQVDDPADYLYYTRRINSIVLPVVWQPHFYMLRNRVRVYLEAAATFTCNLSSTYENEAAREAGDPAWRGDYPFKLARDNRWGYGLAGGGGVAFLLGRFEVNLRVRYCFGLSDIVRNRNRYADNGIDGPENPFYATPMRSPIDNLSIGAGLSYRFNKEGFEAWKPRPKRAKNREVFKYEFTH